MKEPRRRLENAFGQARAIQKINGYVPPGSSDVRPAGIDLLRDLCFAPPDDRFEQGMVDDRELLEDMIRVTR